jgi:type IV pilus assembly protein PilB
MGIEPYLVASSVVGVVAQRLVRRICENCETATLPTEFEKEFLGLQGHEEIYRGNGCSACGNTGYKGRGAVHEIMAVTKAMRELINNRNSMDEIKKAIVAQGTITLKENCKQLILSGITTTEELIKVAYSLE